MAQSRAGIEGRFLGDFIVRDAPACISAGVLSQRWSGAADLAGSRPLVTV